MHDHANPQNTLRRYGAPLLFLVAAIIVWYSYFQMHFQGLRAPDAMRYAAMAQRLVDGKGFSDCQVWPRQLLYTPHPPFYANRTPPLHPVLISLLFTGFGIQESMVAFASSIFFMLLVPLTFILARDLFGKQVALLSGFLLIIDRMMLRWSISGLTELTFGFFLILSLILLVKANPAVAGVAFALAYLTRPGAVAFLFPVVVYVVLFKRRWTDLGSFLVGFAVCLSPYFVWKYIRFGNPFLEVNVGLVLRNSAAFPGETIVRSFEPLSITGYIFSHPGVVLGKLVGELEKYYNSFFNLTNPYLLALFVVGVFQLCDHNRYGSLISRFCVLVYILFGVDVLLSSITSPEEGLRFLVPFLPFVCMFASKTLLSFLQELRMPKVWLVIAFVSFVIFVTWPTFYYDFYRGANTQPSSNKIWAEFGTVLRTETGDNAIVISSNPNEMCWYGNREVLDLPLSLADVESRTRIDAIFLTTKVRLGSDSGMWKEVYGTERIPGYYLAGRYEVEGVKAWLFKKGQDK